MKCVFGACPKDFTRNASDCVSARSCRSYCDLLHEESCTYYGPQRQESWHATWMKEFENVSLNKLIMPSAHHFLSRLGALDTKYIVEKRNALNTVLKICAPVMILPGYGDLAKIVYASLFPMLGSTQNKGSDAGRLLSSGVRHLDVRPYLSRKEDELYDYHTARGPKVEDAFGQIASYARSHPSEVVFVYLSNILWGDENCYDCQDESATFERLNQAVRKHFGDCGGGMLLCEYINATHKHFHVRERIKDLVKKGNVIIHTNNWNFWKAHENPGRVHWNGLIFSGPWYNTNNLTTLKSKILNNTDLQGLSRNNDHVMIAHQWLMSPSDEDFIGAMTQYWTGEFQKKANGYGCQSLACFAEVANAERFKNFFSEIRAKYHRSNFLMLDFADRPETMDFIREANRNYTR